MSSHSFKSQCVLFAARDPGAANVLAQYLKIWKPETGVRVVVWAMGKARPAFIDVGYEFVSFEEDADESEILSAWNDIDPHIMITGTSHYSPFEAYLWRWAKEKNIPTLAWIDYWTNFESRFRHGRPQNLAVLDDGLALIAKSQGFSENNIIIVGHPLLHNMSKLKVERSVIGQCPEQSLLNVLFVSERFYEDVAEGLLPYPGFDEFDAFQIVYEGALQAAKCHNKTINLQVKFHPYEQPDRFKNLAESLEKHEGICLSFLEPEVRLSSVLENNDIVFGMGSMALLEALLLGIPAFSVQPNRRVEDIFPPTLSGYVPSVTDPQALHHHCVELMTKLEARSDLFKNYETFLKTITQSPDAMTCWIGQNLHV